MTSHADEKYPSAQPGEGSPQDQAHTETNRQQGESASQASVQDGQEDANPQAELESLREQVAQLQDQFLRAQAEAENVRRRAQEEISKARKFAIESFAENLVPVRDSLEAAIGQQDQTLEAMREGVETTLKQLTSAFERNHLKEIVPAPGDKFDPHHHQAIATVPAEQPANTVVTVLQKGYLITDRVLRPALVTVAS